MEVVYKLWEGSWETTRRCATARAAFPPIPKKVHRVKHEGKNFRLDAIHLCQPSPQRTPVLYQAGTSPRGRAVRGTTCRMRLHVGAVGQIIAPRVAGIRELAAKAGRDGSEIKMFSMFTVILDKTDAEAKAKYEDYRSHVSAEGALTLMSGWTGVDFSTYDLDQQVRHVENDAGRSAMDNITRADPDRVWAVREVAQHVGIGGIGPVVSARPKKPPTPSRRGSIRPMSTGSNMPFAISPGDFEDITESWCRNRPGAGVTRKLISRDLARKTVRRRTRAARYNAYGCAVQAEGKVIPGSSLPGLTRQSINLRETALNLMDARVIGERKRRRSSNGYARA